MFTKPLHDKDNKTCTASTHSNMCHDLRNTHMLAMFAPLLGRWHIVLHESVSAVSNDRVGPFWLELHTQFGLVLIAAWDKETTLCGGQPEGQTAQLSWCLLYEAPQVDFGPSLGLIKPLLTGTPTQSSSRTAYRRVSKSQTETECDWHPGAQLIR